MTEIQIKYREHLKKDLAPIVDKKIQELDEMPYLPNYA
jgi:hypothetical protein